MTLGGTQKKLFHVASFTFILKLHTHTKKIELVCDFTLAISPVSFLGIVFLILDTGDILGQVTLC